MAKPFDLQLPGFLRVRCAFTPSGEVYLWGILSLRGFSTHLRTAVGSCLAVCVVLPISMLSLGELKSAPKVHVPDA